MPPHRPPAALAALYLACAPTPGPATQEPEPRGVGWEGFPAFVWRLEYSGRECPEALITPFGGTDVVGREEAAWVLEQGYDFYVEHAPGRDELHLERAYPWYDALWQRYYEERDAGVLAREPCLSEPATFELLAGRVERSVAARGGQSGLAISLGDEVGLTPWGDPLDLCASAACRARWARFFPGEFERLGLDLDPRDVPFVSTDDARRAWTAGDTSLIGPWLARRRFHQEVVQGFLARLAERTRELAPETPVSLTGLSGRTAFGGVAVERILPAVDLVECYPLADARELLFTLRGSEQRALRTVFRRDGATHAPAWQIWEHWLRGGDCVVIWCDRDLERDPAYLARTARALADLRELRRRTGAFRPQPRGVALLHSPDSIALSWLRESLSDGPTWPRRFAGYHEQHGARELALRAWLRLAEDAGFLPGSVPIEELGAHTAARFPLLVASHVWVVGPREEERLSEFLAAGGTLLVHGPFAQFDAWGRTSSRGVEERLLRAAPDRAVRLGEELSRRVERYLQGRRGRSARTALALADWLRAAALEAGVAQRPWTLRARGYERAFLIATVPGRRPGEWTAAAIPNAIDREDWGDERMILRPLALELELPEHLSVEWLHPRPAEGSTPVLPAGDAAVFRLVPRDAGD